MAAAAATTSHAVDDANARAHAPKLKDSKVTGPGENDAG
jgi:hypothetical protein